MDKNRNEKKEKKKTETNKWNKVQIFGNYIKLNKF